MCGDTKSQIHFGGSKFHDFGRFWLGGEYYFAALYHRYDNSAFLAPKDCEEKHYCPKLESQINALVYTLYNLTTDEIELIEKG